MPRKSFRICRRSRERGFVLITMGVAAVALFGALGMAVDLGRMFITKNETQAFCDAGALAAVLKLDGTTAGITNAKDAVTNLSNKWNLDSTTVANPDIKFATSSSGPWVADPNPATGYVYAQVTATVSLPLYFISVVIGNTAQSVTSLAKAGQVAYTTPGSPGTNPLFRHGLAPYSAVSTNTTGPNFGLTVGTEYDIQWPNHTAAGTGGCTVSSPDKCFVKNPCNGDNADAATKTAVVSSWSPSISGYWGSTSNSTIEQEILDVIQLQPIDVGTNIAPILTTGNKTSEKNYLDDRVNEDTNITDNNVATYMASTHNGRRLLPVPILDPVDTTHTNVIGYGVFLLYAGITGGGTKSNYYAKDANGNDPYCAIYAGSYFIGSINPGASGSGGSTGAVRASLVQ